jgi:L-cysteine/cystine lyase
MSGAIVDSAALAATDALVLLDGAQGLGAIPIDVHELGCDFYAASGQKWLCGPNGVVYLYVRSERASELDLHHDARRLGVGLPAPHDVEWALAALDVLEEPGLPAVQERAIGLAAELAAALGERVLPRGRSTLVTWTSADPEGDVERLREQGFVLRFLPGAGTVRASVGGWSSEAELERLVELVA